MTHLMGYFLVFGLLVLLHTAAAGPGGGKPAEFIIRAEAGMLTLKARDVSQRRILDGLAKQLNFELIVAGPLEEHAPWKSMANPGKKP